MELPTYHYTEEVQRRAFYEQMFKKIVALPGIESAGAVSYLPIGSVQRLGGSITIEGRQEKEEHFHGYHVVTPGFFEAMGVRLLSGRVFTERDNAAGPPVAILNQKAAMRYWPDGDAVGRQIMLDGPDYEANWGEILRLVIKGCLKLSGKGILIGLLLSIPIGIFMAPYLYGVGGLDPLTYGGVILLLLAVALAAGYLPARRATRIDPMLALRYE